MTQLLQQAFTELQKLPDSEQDAVAALILDELADERLWQEKFANSLDKLTQLAQRARAEIQAGKVRVVGIDEL